MDPKSVQALYGGGYAEQYDSIWPESDRWSAESAHHERTIGALLADGDRWLDVGCGTGWNLSRFPGVARAGLDLSPDMLRQARSANPDALFFREGDIRDDVPEWHDGWDLVTCNGQPWSYVASMAEMEVVADNLARWTAFGGRCLMPVGDLTDLTGQELIHPRPGEEWPHDTPIITGVVWSLYEHERMHRHMIWPSLGFWIEVFGRHFRKIEILRWPHDPPFLPIARRSILASEKRRPGDDAALEVIEHPVPGSEGAPAAVTSAPVASPASRVAASDADSTGLPSPGQRIPGRSLRDQPLSYIASRVRPQEARFWRSAIRRARRLTGR